MEGMMKADLRPGILLVRLAAWDWAVAWKVINDASLRLRART